MLHTTLDLGVVGKLAALDEEQGLRLRRTLLDHAELLGLKMAARDPVRGLRSESLLLPGVRGILLVLELENPGVRLGPDDIVADPVFSPLIIANPTELPTVKNTYTYHGVEALVPGECHERRASPIVRREERLQHRLLILFLKQAPMIRICQTAVRLERPLYLALGLRLRQLPVLPLDIATVVFELGVLGLGDALFLLRVTIDGLEDPGLDRGRRLGEETLVVVGGPPARVGEHARAQLATLSRVVGICEHIY